MSQAFRRGFLYSLAANGMTPEDFGRAVMEKMAAVKQAMGPWDAAGMGLNLATAAAIGGPIVLGGLGGTLAAKLTAPNYTTSIRDAKEQELIRQLQAATRQIKRRTRPALAATPRPLALPSPYGAFGATNNPGQPLPDSDDPLSLGVSQST